MDDKHFKTALWGFSWDDVLEESDACEQGAAKLEDNRISLDIPFGQILSDSSLYSLRNDDAKPDEVDYLYGFTQDGWFLALADAHGAGTGESFPGGPQQHVHATEILASRDRFNPHHQVKEVRACLMGLREWYGKAPYSAHHFPEDRKTVYELDMKADNAQNAVLYKCDEYSIRLFHHIMQSSIEADGFHVEHDCVVQITFDNFAERKNAEAIMVRFSDYISLCVGFDAQIASIEYDIVDGSEPVLSYTPFVVGAKPTQRQLDTIPLRYQDLKPHIGESIGLWLNADKHFTEISNLLCSLLFNSWNLPLDLKFTGASQVLESLSKYKVDMSALPIEQYQQYHSCLKELFDSLEDRKLRDWATNRISGNDKGQGRLLNELLERHNTISDWLVPNRKAFVKSQIASRNYYAHRHNSDGALKGASLYWHTEGALLLCYAIVLELAGVPTETILEGIRGSNQLNRITQNARALYRAKQ